MRKLPGKGLRPGSRGNFLMFGECRVLSRGFLVAARTLPPNVDTSTVAAVGTGTISPMLKFALFLLLVWAVATVLGFVIKGLLWLGYAGLVLFIATAIWVYFQNRAD